MSLRRIGFLLGVIGTCGLGFAAAPPHASLELGRPLVRNFTARDYQADPLCQAVIQGANGVMYFANNVHALAYDGATWRLIAFPPESGGIRQFARGADGTVYLGGSGLLGSLRERDGREDYVSLLPELRGAEPGRVDVYQVLAHGGAVYFVEEQAIHVWRDGSFATIACPMPAGSRGPQLHAVGDRLFVTGRDQPLRRCAGNALEVVADDPVFRENQIVRLERDPADGEALVALTAGRGFFRWRGGVVAPWPTEVERVLAGRRVRSALRGPDGSLVLALYTASGNGALRFGPDGRFLGRIDDSIGLLNRAVRDMCWDTEGGLWLGLESGVTRLEWPAIVTAFDGVNGLGQGFVSDFARHEGAIYASTLEGVYRLAPGDGTATAAKFEQVFSLPVYHLLSHPAGLLAYGYTEVFLLTPAGFKPIAKVSPSMGTLRISKRDPNRVWVKTGRGLQSLYLTAGGWRDEGPVPGVEAGGGTVVETADGSLWMMPPQHGAARVRFEGDAEGGRGTARVERFAGGEAGLPRHHGSTVQEIGGEPIFSFDTTGSLFRFDFAQQRFAVVPGTETLPSHGLEVGWASSEDMGRSEAEVWLMQCTAPAARRSLFRLAAGGAPRALPHAIADATGRVWRMRVERTPEAHVLWLCSANGLFRLEAGAPGAAQAPLAARLHSARVREGAELPPARDAVDFELVAPRFRTGTVVEYQTRLAGYDAAWSAWSTERKRTFTNLPGGHYRFEARARDSDGVSSAPASLAFSVLPPWWRTWWFIGLMGVSGVGAVAGTTRWYAQRVVRRRLALLEAQSAVERERLRLARDLHDEVGSGLGRVILFAEEAEREIDDRTQLAASLARVRTSAKELSQHAREIVWAVSPQHDTLASVIERLGDYVEETLRAAGIACAVEVPPAAKIPPVSLGSEARHSLFLAVKEAVHNCVKYSGAATAEFRLAIEGNDFVVTLRDHGRGFAPGEIAAGGTGHGHASIAARAQVLGGRAEIVSAPGQGTTVALRVPLAGSEA